MSRFVLDCAVARPVSDNAGQWLASSAQRGWASPSAGYHEGKLAGSLLGQATSSAAQLAGARSCWFTADPSSAVVSAVDRATASGGVAAVATSVVDTTVVQQAVREAAAALGMSHIILPVDANGRIQPSALERLESPTVLVTALGNQEIGVVQTPLQHWAQDTGSVVVLDARCAFGWIDLPEHWDFLVLDPRAWGAPAGSAITVARADSPPPIPFDNVPAAVTGVLCGQLWAQQAPDARDSVRRQVEMLRERLSRLTGVELHGGGPDDLPHILSISVLYVDAEAVQTQLDALGFAVGSGSACASRSGEPSHVLAAIGGLTSGNLRIGLPPGLADRTIEEFADAVIDVVTAERSRMGTDDL